MKYGPISAAISAMMKAIESPSSVVCTVSPLDHAPAQLACAAWRIGALALQTIAVTIRQRPRRRAENQCRSKDIYRANCGEVTATSRDGVRREALTRLRAAFWGRAGQRSAAIPDSRRHRAAGPAGGAAGSRW